MLMCPFVKCVKCSQARLLYHVMMLVLITVSSTYVGDLGLYKCIFVGQF
jgi:hypothetical protein